MSFLCSWSHRNFQFAKYTCFKLIVFQKFYYIHLTMIYVICCQEIYTHSMYLHENQEKWNQLWISLHFLFLLVHLLIKSSTIIHFRIHFDIPSLLNESSLYIYFLNQLNFGFCWSSNQDALGYKLKFGKYSACWLLSSLLDKMAMGSLGLWL